MIIKALNKAKAAAVKEEEPAPEEPEEKPADIVLLEEIRDLLKK
jgi:large-conductance mechanosensitive channel